MKDLLTIEEAALELSVYKNTVRAQLEKRRLEFVKIGRSVRIPRAALRRLIEKGTVRAL